MSEQQLKLKRGALKGQLTRFANFLNEITESTDVNELVARLERIEPILETFDTIQTEIELICEEIQDTERTSFEDLYFQIISKAKSAISKQNGEHSVSSVHDNSLSEILDVHSKVKLPPIKLPEFFGSYEQWMTFADIFTSLVHENQSLNNAQKFVYLRNCVRGEAAQLINSLEMTNANYPIAWNILEERYANKKLIVHCHIKNIFDLMPIKFESYTHLRSLLDTFNKNLRTLAALEQPTEQWDTLLVYIVSSKLDTNTKKEWEKCTAEVDFPTVNQLTDFLSKRCNLLETIDNRNKQTKTNNKERILTHISTTASCAFCKGNHLNFDCDKIKNMARSELHAEVKKHRLCLNCLRPFHSHDKCKTPGCKHCGRKHNTLLHIPKNDSVAEPNKVSVVDTPNAVSTENSGQTINLHCSSKTTQVLLATVQLDVLNNDGVPVRARAILDSGSQTSFMTKSLANKLNLPFTETSTPVASINSAFNKINRKVSTDIQSLQENYCKNETFLIIDNITERLPQITFDISKLDIPANIRLADSDCHLTNPVDILLGAGIFFEILSVGQVKLGQDKPILQKTKFGWILSGTLIVSNETPTLLCNFVTSDISLNTQLEQFWKLEEATRNIVYSNEEQECEEHFVENYKRNNQGRFQVALPLKDNYIKLGESETQAISRFHKLEKRFGQDANFKSEYCKFMSEYEQLGHMTRIESDILKQDCLNYYLPHHGVIKESSTTTKLRVVYDASAKTTSGISLNDVLKTGPLIQRDLFSIVLKFRRHNIVFIGDIEKMYRQVEVLPSNRDLQRIVWRDSPERELSHYRLNTVTYGTAPASFLATRCLQQAAFNNLDSFPEASDAIINDFYMDDILSGHDTVQDAIRLKNEITDILSQSGFVLRKFRSNHQSVVESDIQTIEGEYQIFKDESCKTLGLLWNTSMDIFCYSVHLSELKVVTKRTILSTIARIFDPLGLIAPVTIVAKLILQKLWQSKSDWDKSVSMELYTTWNKFFKNLPMINNIKIPRQVTVTNQIKVELHGFCDSSQMAYGCCIYIVSVDSVNKRVSKLLCAKSRVAPLKTVTLPRLELCGALLLAQLSRKCEQALNMVIHEKTYWCDSTITLNWIAGQPNSWKTFVCNRVAEIHELTEQNQWRYISSEQNPADLITRGTTPQCLESAKLWWQGPDFLIGCKESWPNNIILDPVSNTLEKRKPIALSFVNVMGQDQDIFERFSSFKKLIRVTALVLKFVAYLKLRKCHKPYQIKDIEISDLDKATRTLICMVQAVTFSQEIKDLQYNGKVNKNSKLFSLYPFLDQTGIIRVGGRLSNSWLANDKKHPVVLPPNHNFTKLLIEQEHINLFHAGTQATLSSLRCKYWIINGKNAVKQQLHKCVICFKAKPRSYTPLMGDLPESRVTPARPFLKTGCDFAGPVMMKDGRLRTRSLVKAYICIFVCFVTHAVHIELAGELTTECFLNCLKRFVSRRGLCQKIYTDNGKNFVGAERELKRHYKVVQNDLSIKNYLSERKIKWKFIPPVSPHFGGLWEAAVKSAKYHLTRVLREAYLNYEQLYTVLSQIEAILNSRPLTSLSSDPRDLLPLTPSHFLIGDLLMAVPEPSIPETPFNRLRLYQRMQQLVSHFWKRWSEEYITSLQGRTKWQSDSPTPIKVGSLVLLKEPTLPQHWRLGRVVELHPGKDNILRVVSVYTRNGIVKRSVLKLCCLPVET